MSDTKAIRQSVRDHIEKRLGTIYSPVRKLCKDCDGDGTVISLDGRMVQVCKTCHGSGLSDAKD